MNEQIGDWNDLRLVLAVARSGSLSGAARALGVSHPTVFRRVNRIESLLGVRLFDRGRRGYTPTPAGEELAALAERVAEDVAVLERRIAGRDLRPSGTVRVTTTDTLLFELLTPVLAAFRESHPEINLDVVVSNEMFSLSRRDADVAIRPSKAVPEELVGRRVGAIATAVYARTDLAAKTQAGVAIEELPWIGPDQSLSYLPVVRWMHVRGLDARVVYRTNTLLGVRDAVRSGIGLAALPCYLGDDRPELARVGVPIDELESELWLLTHPDLRRVARIRALLEFLAEAFATYRGFLDGSATERLDA